MAKVCCRVSGICGYIQLKGKEAEKEQGGDCGLLTNINLYHCFHRWLQASNQCLVHPPTATTTSHWPSSPLYQNMKYIILYLAYHCRHLGAILYISHKACIVNVMSFAVCFDKVLAIRCWYVEGILYSTSCSLLRMPQTHFEYASREVTASKGLWVCASSNKMTRLYL